MTSDQIGLQGSSQSQAEFVRVWVAEGDGTTFRDLTTYAGTNLVKAVTWSDDIESPCASATVTLYREAFKLSLSPFIAESALNRSYNPGSSAPPLIQIGRVVYIEAAVVPADKQPSSGDWMEVFRGRIDTFDAGQADTLVISARDLSGRFAQQYIKVERVYSFAVVSGVAVPLLIWQPETEYFVDQYVLPATRGSGDPGTGLFFIVTTHGTSGTTEPAWSTGSGIGDGSVVYDYQGPTSSAGNPVEQIIQNIMDDNRGPGDGAVTLYTPTSPGWDISQFIQQRQFTLDAVRALAQQIGWDIRFKWKTGTGFVFTLYCPDRAATSTLWTFGQADYQTPTQLAVDIAVIRNSWQGIFTDSTDLYPDGTGKRKVRQVTDPDSVTKYKELWAEIQEDSVSQIDTPTEMDALLTAAASDCSEPTAVMAIPLVRGFPWVELNDLYLFTASDRYFSTDTKFAVSSFSHSFDDGTRKLNTTLNVRGKPTVGTFAWMTRLVHPKVPPTYTPHRIQHFSGNLTPFLGYDHIIGGTRLTASSTYDKVHLPAEYEMHVYPISGTPLDSTTLQAVSQSNVVEMSHLVPGKTYFSRVVPRWHNADRLIRGQPSAETSFVAAQAQAAHLTSEVDYGRKPLNGGFETQFDPAEMPDHWFITSGALGASVIVQTGAGGISGARWLEFAPAPEAGADTDLFNIDSNADQQLTFWRQNLAGSAVWSVYVFWWDSDQVLISTDQVDVDMTDSVGTWVHESQVFTPASGARFASILISSVNAGDFYVDEVVLGPVLQAGTVNNLEVLGTLTVDKESVFPLIDVGGYLFSRGYVIWNSPDASPGTGFIFPIDTNTAEAGSMSGNAVITATPSLINGSGLGASGNQREVTIMNRDPTNILTLQDEGTLTGSKLRLSTNTVDLVNGSSIRLRFFLSDGFWYEVARAILV